MLGNIRNLVFVSLAGLSILALPEKALAYDRMFEAYVVAIEPTYVSTRITFVTDIGAGSCPAGTWLAWDAKGTDQPSKIANVQAVLAVILTAKAGHTKVRVHGNNAGCTIDFIHGI